MTRGDGSQNGPRSRKGAETRARLIDAAKRVFERDGFLDARISDISETAGLSHGAFYHYFSSKEEVFREVAETQEQRLTERGDGDATAADTPWSRIREANRRYLERYRDAARIMGVIEHMSRSDEHVNAVRSATQKHFAERAEQAIRSWQREGLADRRVDAAIAADALGAMVARFAELWLVQGYRTYDFDDAVDQLTLLWANALGLPGEAPASSRRARGSSS